MSIIQHLRLEARKHVDPECKRWSLFARHSSELISTGSLLKLTYRSNKSSNPNTFTGILITIRRNPGDPTIIVRGIVDDVGVEQVFCIFSPLLEKIEVLKAPEKGNGRKLYALREKPSEISELQKSLKNLSKEPQTINGMSKSRSFVQLTRKAR